MFEFLFNYRAELFGQGHLSLLAGPGRVGLIVLGAIATLWVGYRYRLGLLRAHKTSRSGSALLLVVRGVGVAAIGFALLEPALSLRVLKEQENFVAVLADTSVSMTIPDTQNLEQPADSRAAWLQESFVGDPEKDSAGPFWQKLATRFQVRAYAFDEQVRAQGVGKTLDFGGRESDLGGALQAVRTELTGVPLAGIVVLTDGALETSERLVDESLRLRSAGIPVFPVAVGSSRLERDLEISSVRVSERALLGSTVEAEIHLSYPGFSGKTVTLEVRDGGRVVESRQVELPVGGDPRTTVTIRFQAQEPGTRQLDVRVTSEAGNEIVFQNNSRTVLLQVEEAPHKILYFEGEPRFEYKFIRRAVADDPQLQLVSMLRMADNRFYRQSVDDEDELQGGFPTRREDLFKYRGLVIGSVEASFFSYEQMRMIVDFASKRGGGVLFLGGSRSLAEGGYAGTPLAELIPVELSDLREIGPRGVSVRVRPTRLGQTHAALQFNPSPSSTSSLNTEFWQGLPELLILNRTGRLKPGAAALLTGRSEALDEERLVLAYQRFGRGSSMIFTPSDSFRWQMRLDIEDQTHEILWRQLFRWLIDGVDQQVVVSAKPNRVEAGETVSIVALVRDGRFQEDSNGSVEAEVTSPTGVETTLTLIWDPQLEGAYRGEYSAVETGQHAIQVTVLAAEGASDRSLLKARSSFEVAPLFAEYFGAVQNRQVLEKLARETGGATYNANQTDELFDRLSYSSAGITVQENRPLWNMPVLFFLIVAALLGEWTFRRTRGLR